MVESVVQSHAETVVGSSEKLTIRVLHVDDELGLLKVAKQCLEMQGPFHVDTADSVEEALARLGKEKYNVIVSDYQMPGKDGLEFLKELREKGNAIPFIMFTGKGARARGLFVTQLAFSHAYPSFDVFVDTMQTASDQGHISYQA
jgi:CheY-like chemotaxis protein